jgi:subtilisin family serine protease
MFTWLKAFWHLGITLALFLALMMAGPSSPALAGEALLIKLGSSHFDPLQQAPAGGGKYQIMQSIEPGQAGYYLVQFDGPIYEEWKEALKAQGVEIFDYVPDFAFLVRMDSGLEEAVRGLDHVRWVGVYQPSYRVSTEVKTMSGEVTLGVGDRKAGSLGGLLRVTVFPGADVSGITASITSLGGQVLETTTTNWKTTLKVSIDLDQVPALSALTGVKWVEKYPEWKLHNDKATDIMGVRPPRDDHGLYGSGVTVAVCDTGLDKGTTPLGTLHRDFNDGSGGTRVMHIYDLALDGAPSDVRSGHGTHVAGSVLGNGKESGADPTISFFPDTCFAGMATKANLIMQAVENNTTGALSGIPDDLNTLFAQADTAGAQIHTNSWGSEASGAYTGSSADVDEYVWDNKDFLILFSAGNSGVDANSDGVVDLGSLGSPASAKNCLTVGASENNRTDQTLTYGSAWPSDYPANPIKSDKMADNTTGLAAFSSRGPCLDGRYKPDVVGPGTYILSTRSSVASGSGWGLHDSYYMYMGGTSMSTPLVAGTAALVREYLTTQTAVANPSAALMKAFLINTADDITPGQYGTGSTREIPASPVPNNVEGWGRVNLDNGVYLTAPHRMLVYDEAAGLATSGTKTYAFTVKDDTRPLKVNLAWSDYPGVPVYGGLVNDLDLKVTDPNGIEYLVDNPVSADTFYSYASGDIAYYNTAAQKQAIKFTPSQYPATLKQADFLSYTASGSPTACTVKVYDDDGAGGLPGTVLFSSSATPAANYSWVNKAITGVTITSGSFYVAVEQANANQGLIVDNSNPSGRGYYHNGSAWAAWTQTPYIGVKVSGVASDYDRINNVEGVTLTTPIPGKYTVTVSGYNVPQGPQPFALVARGNLGGAKGMPMGSLMLLLLDN